MPIVRLSLSGFALVLLSACGSDEPPSERAGETGGTGGAGLGATGGAAVAGRNQGGSLATGGSVSAGGAGVGGAVSGGGSGGTTSGSGGTGGASSAGGPSVGGAAGSEQGGAGSSAGGAPNTAGGSAGATGGIGGTGGSGGGTGGVASGGTAGSGAGNAGMGGAAGTAGGPATGSCTPARPHASGNSTVTLRFGGRDRSYLLHVPAAYDGTKPLPLVFDVHGLSSFASEQRVRSKWDQMADREGFVLINPEGVDRSWNAGSCCGGNQQDDVGFFREIVTRATAELCIDSKRVYVSGHSNGGAMTYRLACEAADIFAAVAPVCGWMAVSTCAPARPIPVLAMRGLNDSIVTINTADGDIDEWLSHDNCAEDQVTTSGVCRTYASCDAGTEVMDCRPRGNHDFFYGSNPDNYLVPDNAWAFFKQFSLPLSF